MIRGILPGVPSIVKAFVVSESVTVPFWSARMSLVTFVELLVEVVSATVDFLVLSPVVVASCAIIGRRRWQETHQEVYFKFNGYSQDRYLASWLMIFGDYGTGPVSFDPNQESRNSG
jgi:hypothetical protein